MYIIRLTHLRSRTISPLTQPTEVVAGAAFTLGARSAHPITGAKLRFISPRRIDDERRRRRATTKENFVCVTLVRLAQLPHWLLLGHHRRIILCACAADIVCVCMCVSSTPKCGFFETRPRSDLMHRCTEQLQNTRRHRRRVSGAHKRNRKKWFAAWRV